MNNNNENTFSLFFGNIPIFINFGNDNDDDD